MTEIKKVRADGQLSGMAGEFLVAGKLFKRGMQVAVTLGNAKSIDPVCSEYANRENLRCAGQNAPRQELFSNEEGEYRA